MSVLAEMAALSPHSVVAAAPAASQQPQREAEMPGKTETAPFCSSDLRKVKRETLPSSGESGGWWMTLSRRGLLPFFREVDKSLPWLNDACGLCSHHAVCHRLSWSLFHFQYSADRLEKEESVWRDITRWNREWMHRGRLWDGVIWTSWKERL